MRTRLLFLIIAAAALMMVSCSGGAEVVDSATQDAGATSGETTTEAESGDSSTSANPAPTTEVDEPTGFSGKVKPVLQANCVSCHSEGGPGSSHFDLNNAGDAQKVANEIALVTSVRYMPPWPASDQSVPFHDDRTMTQEDIDAISAWAAEGAQLDVPADDPLEATVQIWPEIDWDYVITAEPYKGSVENVDDYRCQIYDPELTEPSYLQKYDLIPDRTEVVHHALVFRADAALRPQAEERDREDEAPGWECFGLSGLGSEDGSADQIMGWAPGQQPNEFPEDTGILMQPGDFVIMQIHYHYEEKWADLPADMSSVALQFADEAAIEAAGGELTPIDLALYLGPAEIPCSENEEGPLCDRETALAIIQEEVGGFAGSIANLLLRQCGQSVEDYADQTSGFVSSSCDLNARPGEIISIFGHEHEIGATFRMTLNPDTDEERILLDIPAWDFDWQLVYSPEEKIILDDDDVIRVECSWDRAKIEAGNEPRYIVWADGTEDEMCYSQIFTRPVE